ncbi:YncE family protein [Natrononativus amylolyticus]|uniref:YncE family protein n=1 Tax=Natrononativus amylolyticus TaxID=2963434 RepID=UPI0020CD08CC|nr:hypothetical protein [Natrononativus amylolyticus]
MQTSMGRRRFVRVAGAGIAVGLAGCLGDDGDEPAETNDSTESTNSDGGESDDAPPEPGSEGLVYAFAPDTIALIDPDEGAVVNEITDGVDGAEWGDPRITADRERIFVTEGSRARLAVVNTATRALEEWVDVGPDPVHAYNPVEGEIWAHSDAEGAFYVVDAETLEVLDTVESGLEGGGHGKLLSHPDLGERAYGANVTAPAATTIDLAERERTGHVDLGEEGGTHYKAYAPETGLAYFQRSGVGETAVVDTERDELADALPFDGGLYLSPDETLLAVLDGETVRFVDATSEDSEVVGEIDVEGEPGALRYYEGDDALYAFAANTEPADVAVLDVDRLEEIDRLAVGAIDGRYRAGVAGGDYFVTPSDADGTVAVVDMAARELVAEVDVAPGVDTVQYVGESGTGYSSR